MRKVCKVSDGNVPYSTNLEAACKCPITFTPHSNTSLSEAFFLLFLSSGPTLASCFVSNPEDLKKHPEPIAAPIMASFARKADIVALL